MLARKLPGRREHCTAGPQSRQLCLPLKAVGPTVHPPAPGPATAAPWDQPPSASVLHPPSCRLLTLGHSRCCPTSSSKTPLPAGNPAFPLSGKSSLLYYSPLSRSKKSLNFPDPTFCCFISGKFKSSSCSLPPPAGFCIPHRSPHLHSREPSSS